MKMRERKDIFRVMEAEQVEKSQEDVRKRHILFPKRIVWTKGKIENPEALLAVREQQISLKASAPCVMKNAEGTKASVLLDYGIEIHGGVRIAIWNGKGEEASEVKVRIRFGESVSEAMSELGAKTMLPMIMPEEIW